MSRNDLTLIEKISILVKIKGQPKNTSVRELEKLRGKSVISRIGKTMKMLFVNSGKN